MAINILLEAYFKDPSIEPQRKSKLAADLDSGKIDEERAVGIISEKYPQLHTSVTNKVVGGLASSIFKSLSPSKMGQLAGQALPTVAKGFGSTMERISPGTPEEAAARGQAKQMAQEQFMQNIMPYGREVAMGKRIVENTLTGLTGGAGKVYQAGTEAGEAISGVGPQGEILSPEDRAIKGTSALGKVGAGGMELAFAAPGAVMGEIPIAREAIGAGLEGVNSLSQGISDSFKGTLKGTGIQMSPQQEQVIDQHFQNLGQASVMKALQDMSHYMAREAAKKKALQTGNIAEYEKLTAIKPTISENIFGPMGQQMKDFALTELEGMKQAGQFVGKKVGQAGHAVKEGAQYLKEEGLSKATGGLSHETMKLASEHPGELSAAQKAGLGATKQNIFEKGKLGIDTKLEELSSTGKAYESIRTSPGEVKLPAKWLDREFKDLGLKVKDGKLAASTSSKVRAPADVAALQRVYDLWKGKDKMSNAEFLNLRQDLDVVAKFEAGKTSASASAAKGLRTHLNEVGRSQVPNLEAIDNQFSIIKEDLRTVKNLIYDKQGNLKPNALETITNLKGGRLEALEQASPGIAQDIKILRALKNIEDASGNKVGAYFRGAGVAGSLVTGNVPGVVASIMTSPKIVIKMLEKWGELKGNAAQATQVINKVNSGTPLTGASAAFAKEAIAKGGQGLGVRDDVVSAGQSPFLKEGIIGEKRTPHLALGDKALKGQTSTVDVGMKVLIGTERMKRLAKSGKLVKLDQVIDHPELFDNYPELRKVNVKFDRLPKDVAADTKVFKGGDAPYLIVLDPFKKVDLKSIIVHELQHSVDIVESPGILPVRRDVSYKTYTESPYEKRAIKAQDDLKVASKAPKDGPGAQSIQELEQRTKRFNEIANKELPPETPLPVGIPEHLKPFARQAQGYGDAKTFAESNKDIDFKQLGYENAEDFWKKVNVKEPPRINYHSPPADFKPFIKKVEKFNTLDELFKADKDGSLRAEFEKLNDQYGKKVVTKSNWGEEDVMIIKPYHDIREFFEKIKEPL